MNLNEKIARLEAVIDFQNEIIRVNRKEMNLATTRSEMIRAMNAVYGAEQAKNHALGQLMGIDND